VTWSTLRTAILTHDDRLSERVRALAAHPGVVRGLAIVLARSGDALWWLIALTLVGLLGDPSWRSPVGRIAIAMVGTGLVVRFVKAATRRDRPPGGWGTGYRRTDPHAFPSGHSARAAMLTALGVAICPWWIGVALALWTLLVAASRVALGVHYLSDVVAGAALGTLCGLLAAAR
jgi:undecaprenyl-diphosphatase